MKPKKQAAALLAIVLALAPSAFAAEGGGSSKEEQKPVGPPQPRVLESPRPEALPPRKTDPSWLDYQEGLGHFEDKRLGDALLSFRKAIEERSSLFKRASADIDAALAVKEAAKVKAAVDAPAPAQGAARDYSLAAFTRLLALRDMIPQAYEALHEKAGGSLLAEMRLLRETAPSGALRGLIDATLLVAEEGGASRFGDSVRKLRQAARDFESYPEAEFQLGRIYMAEGESRLAELQMLKAREMSASLERPEDLYAMLESLAELYKARGDLKGYESSLRAIADSSALFSAKDEYYRNSMERILGGRGFDLFMKLYRVDESYAVGAYAKLGELYLEAGRPIATLYFAAAANAVLTRAIREIRIDEPGYEFSSLAELASRIAADREMADYAARTRLWKSLVLLGESLTASGARDTARDIWSAVASARGSELWGKKAAEDLARFGRR